jgi:sRNA-binding regulator protein Hfq
MNAIFSNTPQDAARLMPTITTSRDSFSGGRDRIQAGPIARPKFVAKGHDRQLEEAQFGKFFTTILPMGNDEAYLGKIIRRDKYTVTIMSEQGVESMVYKHAIESICIDRSKTVA